MFKYKIQIKNIITGAYQGSPGKFASLGSIAANNELGDGGVGNVDQENLIEIIFVDFVGKQLFGVIL